MAVLQPGTTPTGFTAGSYQDANTYTLDGGNITDDMAGNTIGYQTNYSGIGGSQGGSIPSGVIPTPIESIEELKVSVSNQTSDFTSSSGAQIQMVTKRGSNQFHGSAYIFYYDNAIGASRVLESTITRPSPSVVYRCRIRRQTFPRTTAAALAAPSGAR